MLAAIRDKLKRILPEGLNVSDLILYVLVIAGCYLLFQQADLFNTSSSSYAYLNGHIRDFYDYNNTVIPGEGAYLPLIYIIFAIWNLPLKLFGVMHNVAANGILLNVAELAWTKLLIVVFYFAAAYVIFLIGKTLTGQSQKAKYLAVIFVTSPIAIFAAFIFGQYDIVGIFLMMMGFYFYIRGDLLRFSIFFSLAISLKMFPLIVFIPLLLLAEKKILSVIKYGVIALAATLLQIAVYYPSASFRQDIFYLAGARVSTLAELSLSTLNSSPYLIIFFTILCIYAYLRDIDQAAEHYRSAISISMLSFALLFSTIDWNPQWLIMIMPFFALSYLFVKDPSRAYLLDILGMFSFTYIVVHQWVNNADANMLFNGIFRSLFAYIPLLNYQLFPARFIHVFMGILFVYLFSPLLIQWFQRPTPSMDEGLDGFIRSNNSLRARFYLGVSIFVIPTLFCALAPKEIARKIDPTAYSIAGLAIPQVDSLVGNINKNVSIKQSFVAETANLFKVNVQFSTWARVNLCEVTLTLLDDSNHVVASDQIDCQKIVDNAYYSFEFQPIKNSQGKMYSIEVQSNGTSKNSITAWKSSSDVYPPGKLYKNGNEETGDLSIAIFYDR